MIVFDLHVSHTGVILRTRELFRGNLMDHLIYHEMRQKLRTNQEWVSQAEMTPSIEMTILFPE